MLVLSGALDCIKVEIVEPGDCEQMSLKDVIQQISDDVFGRLTSEYACVLRLWPRLKQNSMPSDVRFFTTSSYTNCIYDKFLYKKFQITASQP